jgi:hypothetical protein
MLAAFPSETWANEDKDHIELTCGTTKASITCTKFEDTEIGKHVCVASTLAFDTQDGKHVVSNYKPPQNFDIPTIPDSLSCVKTKTKEVISLESTPDCTYANCVTIDLFSISGKHLAHNNKNYQNIMGDEEPSFIRHETLRGDQND